MYEYTDEIINYLVKILKKYERIDIHNENKKIDFETCIKMAQEFLDEIKIDINIEKILNEQSLVFRTEFDGYKSDGVSSYDEEKNRKIVSVNKTEDIKMVAVIVHELLHYYNQPEDNNRAMASDFLTEVISYAYELILLNKYLESEYGAEAKDMITLVFRTLMYRTNLIYTPVCSIKYYKSKKLTVEGISSDGKIEIYLRDMKEFISKNYTISEELWNTIGYHLGIYCYIEYKKDPNFIYKLSKLNDSINIKSFMECIKIIGLNDINELYEKGMTNLEKYIELIKSYQEEKNTEKKLNLK